MYMYANKGAYIGRVGKIENEILVKACVHTFGLGRTASVTYGTSASKIQTKNLRASTHERASMRAHG